MKKIKLRKFSKWNQYLTKSTQKSHLNVRQVNLISNVKNPENENLLCNKNWNLISNLNTMKKKTIGGVKKKKKF